MRKYLNITDVRDFIAGIPEGSIFSVVFEKRDGTLRRMSCKTGVTKHLHGGEATYDANPDNVGVFDMEAGAYRCFNGTRVLRIRGDGKAVGDATFDADVVNARGEVVKPK